MLFTLMSKTLLLHCITFYCIKHYVSVKSINYINITISSNNLVILLLFKIFFRGKSNAFWYLQYILENNYNFILTKT